MEDRGRARCALASALVKVARLSPPVSPLTEPISTLVDGGDIASRVHRLLDDTMGLPRARSRWAWLFVAAAVPAAIALAYAPLLLVVHHATELLVHAFL
jgi:hypothetical protein